MPLYTYTCDEGHSLDRFCTIAEMEAFEITSPKCECQRELRRVYAPRRHLMFHEGFYEHTTEEGVYCSSMQELRSAAREAGNYSEYAETLGSAFGAKENRWI